MLHQKKKYKYAEDDLPDFRDSKQFRQFAREVLKLLPKKDFVTLGFIRRELARTDRRGTEKPNPNQANWLIDAIDHLEKFGLVEIDRRHENLTRCARIHAPERQKQGAKS